MSNVLWISSWLITQTWITSMLGLFEHEIVSMLLTTSFLMIFLKVLQSRFNDQCVIQIPKNVTLLVHIKVSWLYIIYSTDFLLKICYFLCCTLLYYYLADYLCKFTSFNNLSAYYLYLLSLVMPCLFWLLAAMSSQCAALNYFGCRCKKIITKQDC
jgi:hypothetical protein